MSHTHFISMSSLLHFFFFIFQSHFSLNFIWFFFCCLGIVFGQFRWSVLMLCYKTSITISYIFFFVSMKCSTNGTKKKKLCGMRYMFAQWKGTKKNGRKISLHKQNLNLNRNGNHGTISTYSIERVFILKS